MKLILIAMLVLEDDMSYVLSSSGPELQILTLILNPHPVDPDLWT